MFTRFQSDSPVVTSQLWNRRPNRPLTWGPVGDQTLCAMVNDLLVRARRARPYPGRSLALTCGNGLALLPGGQVVAGSNPVSPT
jgi:hypothetical protein